jgi:C4-dicarboxylate-specific signal transduction histidine kinase
VKDLQERTEELTGANAQLQREIAERKQAEEEIRKLIVLLSNGGTGYER